MAPKIAPAAATQGPIRRLRVLPSTLSALAMVVIITRMVMKKAVIEAMVVICIPIL